MAMFRGYALHITVAALRPSCQTMYQQKSGFSLLLVYSYVQCFFFWAVRVYQDNIYGASLLLCRDKARMLSLSVRPMGSG